MVGEIKVADAQEAQQLMEAYFRAALSGILAPIPINRFLISNSPHGPNPVMVMGTAVLLEAPGFPKAPVVSVVSSVSFPKNVAEDMVVNLERAFGITEDDRKAAYVRNPVLPAQS